MKWFILFVGVVVLCCTLALVFGLVGGGMSRGTSSLSHEPLPDDELADADFDGLHFDVGLRGYRMSEVDGVIDRLRRELREKDEQIGVLRGVGAPAVEGPSQSPAELEVLPSNETAATEAASMGAEPADTRAVEADPEQAEQALQTEPIEKPLHSEPHG